MRCFASLLVIAAASVACAQAPVVNPEPAHITVPKDISAQVVKDPATPEQVREYFRVIGLDQTMKKLMSQMFAAMKSTSAPYIPESVWADMETTFNNYDLLSEIIPIYQQHLSRSDMEAVLGFYKTDAGRHLLENQDVMSAEAQAKFRKIGQRLGEEVGMRHSDEIVAAQKKYEQGLVNKQKPELVMPPPDPK
jgi:hypothetical protein